jgi:NADPH:quinone reductase-like Zn-dependent oxidoreductase
MKAILFDSPGDEDVLYLGQAPEPSCGHDDLRIAVSATAVNRADLLQRRGVYPPPPGASSILGLEVSGRVLEAGDVARAAGFTDGQRVMALLPGGGYAEQVVVHHGLAMRVPARLSDEAAAAIPEAFLTAYLNLFVLGGLQFGDPSRPGRPVSGPFGEPVEVRRGPRHALIHGGASGVGTAAIQLCRESGVTPLCTVGSKERAERCRALGAQFCWIYHDGDFTDAVLRETDHRGVDAVLDCVGGKYLDQNIRVLAHDGRLLCIGLMHGVRAELDLARLLAHRLQIIGSTLRSLPRDRKEALVRRFTAEVLPLFASGRIAPVIDRVLPITDVRAAHRAMDEHHVGKIVLRVAGTL